MAIAKVVSAEKLAASIDAAVALASRKLNVLAAKPNLSLKWEIVGRMVSRITPSDAFDLAEAITAKVKVAGIEAQPAISKIGDDILVGFIERGQLPRSFGG